MFGKEIKIWKNIKIQGENEASSVKEEIFKLHQEIKSTTSCDNYLFKIKFVQKCVFLLIFRIF